MAADIVLLKVTAGDPVPSASPVGNEDVGSLTVTLEAKESEGGGGTEEAPPELSPAAAATAAKLEIGINGYGGAVVEEAREPSNQLLNGDVEEAGSKNEYVAPGTAMAVAVVVEPSPTNAAQNCGRRAAGSPPDNAVDLDVPSLDATEAVESIAPEQENGAMDAQEGLLPLPPDADDPSTVEDNALVAVERSHPPSSATDTEERGRVQEPESNDIGAAVPVFASDANDAAEVMGAQKAIAEVQGDGGGVRDEAAVGGPSVAEDSAMEENPEVVGRETITTATMDSGESNEAMATVVSSDGPSILPSLSASSRDGGKVPSDRVNVGDTSVEGLMSSSLACGDDVVGLSSSEATTVLDPGTLEEKLGLLKKTYAVGVGGRGPGGGERDGEEEVVVPSAAELADKLVEVAVSRFGRVCHKAGTR